MADLRPIILVNRLKCHLLDIVSPTQYAFVSKRLIFDNILITHEIVHSLRTYEDVSGDFMAIKLDMSKAYNRVEWSFLEEILIGLGFNDKWVSWMMSCVKMITYAVLINGCPYGLIKPERGLRQGDPLSPFLFVLCTEALIHLINRADSEGKLSGIQFHHSGHGFKSLIDMILFHLMTETT